MSFIYEFKANAPSGNMSQWHMMRITHTHKNLPIRITNYYMSLIAFFLTFSSNAPSHNERKNDEKKRN